jgi:hypothetical protein
VCKAAKGFGRVPGLESAEKEFFSECKHPVIRLNEKSEIMEFTGQSETVKLRVSRRRLGESETQSCLSADSNLLLHIVEKDCLAAFAIRYSYRVPRGAYCVSVWCGRYRSRGIMVLFAALLSFRWPNIAAG